MRRWLSKYVLLAATLSCGGNQAKSTDTARAEASATAGASTASTPITNTLPPTHSKTIVFVGTSLTAGYGLDPDSAYPQQIQRMIDSAGFHYSVVNAGVSGETSSALVRRLDWLLRQPIAIVVIETGANDGLRGIPIETMRSNIQRIIERIRTTQPRARVVLVQMEAPPNLGAQYTMQFREVFPDLAKRNAVTLLPFLLRDVAGDPDLNQADGLHPNYVGEQIVTQNVWKGLRPLLQ